MPVIGWLSAGYLASLEPLVSAFRKGLGENGYVEGQSVAVEYRWADDQVDRLPALATDLVRRRVSAIAAIGTPAAFAAKAATTAVPIVFLTPGDPVSLGLVASIARPERNLTGTNFLAAEVIEKRFELLRELAPKSARVAVLVEPSNVRIAEATVTAVEKAARIIGVQIQVLKASTSREIDAAFETFGRELPDALFVTTSAFFTSRRVQLVHWATHYRVPATYSVRQYVDVGGLMSYGASLTDACRQVGIYASRILKGARPADLPVVQSSKFELVINNQTARILGLPVPSSLLATADEVIE
jgi:putative ABC transport system substrate-binding protein